jgi:hypothetical protein
MARAKCSVVLEYRQGFSKFSKQTSRVKSAAWAVGRPLQVYPLEADDFRARRTSH